MTESELNLALEWAAAEGWNPGLMAVIGAALGLGDLPHKEITPLRLQVGVGTFAN